MKISKHVRKITIIGIIFSFVFSFYAYSNVKTRDIKRIISVAYDDSWSMAHNGQNYSYASYALQNLIALMNDNDKLNVVKISSKDDNILFHVDDFYRRKEEIEQVKNYTPLANDTNFQTVRNAVTYLEEMRDIYGNDSNYRYYLLVLTDGRFDNMPSNLSDYLNEVSNNFRDVSYNGIFIGIGNDVPVKFQNNVLNASNNYYISCNDNESIVNAVYAAHDIMYDRNVIDQNMLQYGDKKSCLYFDSEYDINKVIVIEKNQKVGLIGAVSNNNISDTNRIFECEKIVNPNLDSLIYHSFNNSNIIKNGKVKLDFIDNINKNSDRLRVMVEYDDYNINLSKKNIEYIGNKDNKDDKDLHDTDIIEESIDDKKVPDDGLTIKKSYVQYNPIPITETYTSFLDTETVSTHTIITTTEKPMPNCPVIPRFPWWLLLLLLFTIGSYIFWPYFWIPLLRNGREGYKRNIFLRILRLLHIPLILILFLLLWPYLGCARCGTTYFSPVTVAPTEPIPGPAPTPTTELPGPGPIPSSTEPTPDPTYPTTIEPTYPTTVEPKPTPPPPPTPTSSSFLPFLIFALLLGYVVKPRFDRKCHDFTLYDGLVPIDTGSMIKINTISKFIPYLPERGIGYDMPIKACLKKDRVIVDNNFISNDMKLENAKVNNRDKLILYENMKLIKPINGKILTYTYRYVPFFEKNI